MDVKCGTCMYYYDGTGVCRYDPEEIAKSSGQWCHLFIPNDPDLCYCENCMFGISGHCRIGGWRKPKGTRCYCEKFRAVMTTIVN